jgi:hypothetical protein
MNDDIDVGEPHENWLLRHSFMASCFLVASAALITFIPSTGVENTKSAVNQSVEPQSKIAEYTP